MTGIAIDATADCAGGALEELRTRPEQLVFFLAEPSDNHDLRVFDRVPLAEQHLVDTGWHVQLTDAGRQWVLQIATATTGWLVEAHSHGPRGDPACFSPTDRTGLAAWVPHLRWRLPGRGYGALVLGSRTVDGLAWLPHDPQPRALAELRTAGATARRATRRSLAAWIRDGR